MHCTKFIKFLLDISDIIVTFMVILLMNNTISNGIEKK
jgi:hypothetical protein